MNYHPLHDPFSGGPWQDEQFEDPNQTAYFESSSSGHPYKMYHPPPKSDGLSAGFSSSMGLMQPPPRLNSGPETQNSRYLQRIYKHPYYYIIDPRTPDVPINPENFMKFLDLVRDVLYSYNQIQHGGIKLCTFCFCWINRKLKFDTDPCEPDEVEPEYTMAEALGKMDEDPRTRYATFIGLVGYMQQTGYRPLCKVDPTRFKPGESVSKNSKPGLAVAPANFVACGDQEWIPHLPKFTCGVVVHKCFNHYLKGGVGAAEAQQAKHIARERARERRKEALNGGPNASLGEMIGLHPDLARCIDSCQVIPTYKFEIYPPRPQMRNPYSQPLPLGIVDNTLVAKLVKILGFQKLAIVANGAIGPLRIDLNGCKFYTNPLSLQTEKVRQWAYKLCTGKECAPTQSESEAIQLQTYPRERSPTKDVKEAKLEEVAEEQATAAEIIQAEALNDKPPKKRPRCQTPGKKKKKKKKRKSKVVKSPEIESETGDK